VANPTLKSGRRRLRLYACACCRQVWHLLHEEGRAAVEAAEGHADGQIAPADLRKAGDLATSQSYVAMCRPTRIKGVAGAPRPSKEAVRCARWAAMHAARLATESSITTQAGQASWYALRAAGYLAEDNQAAVVAHCRLQCDLLRDVFGNPFRPVSADPAWLRWNDGTVRKMAQAFYEERAFERLPLLADALEDAGCDNADLLGHLCGPGPHVRGCWVVDALLRKP
jgi:hypothetical protein